MGRDSLFEGIQHTPSLTETISDLAEKIFVSKMTISYTGTSDQRTVIAAEAFDCAISFFKLKRKLLASKEFRQLIVSDQL